jgi:hypothetical protein
MGDYNSEETFFENDTGGGSAIANIFSQFPLINSNAIDNNGNSVSYRGDGVDPTEILNFIFKKQFGIPNARPYSTYNTEATQSSLANSTKDRQFSQEIPYECPIDIYEDIDFRSNIANNPNINIIAGINSTDYTNADFNQAKYISSSHPYLVFYSNIIMKPVNTNSKLSFYAVDYVNPFNVLTQNAISYYYSLKNNNIYNNISDSTRLYNSQLKLYDITGTTELSFGNRLFGSWLIDTDSGIVTFYDNVNISITDDDGVTTTIPVDGINNPPRISFWRYEGLIGNNTVMSVQDF